MKLLISAYACTPNRGSEHGVGWSWTTEARRLGHEVWALVSPAHRDAIEKASRSDPVCAGIHWVFPELSYWPLEAAKEPKWERTYNLIWQRVALRAARRLQHQVGFDAIHHLTWGGIRAPTFLGSLGPPLIVGPMGGGETSPYSLRDGFSFRGWVLETVRDLSNSTLAINPLVGGGFDHAAVIFAKTADTRNLLSDHLREKTIVFGELGIRKAQIASPRVRRQKPPRLLYAGRLLYWKGVHIAIQAFAELLAKIPDARFTIVGSGPEDARLRADAQARKVSENIDFISWLPQNKLFELYDSHDLLLFPSLHDSSGGVVLESLCQGMPVVCLDLGGPKDIVTPNSGIIIKTTGLNTAQVASSIANEICQALSSPTMLADLSRGAISRASDFILSDRVAKFYQEASRVIEGDGIRSLPTLNAVAEEKMMTTFRKMDEGYEYHVLKTADRS
jgi:glycosyltransferase involved in cell wall biosynthesis